eukprot:GHRR01007831.1.p1 GENE.GHRR01007831.1~~GHRR01007831.1.p1  ORF type:complete len:433 (+),score=143.65 GHRR01007831.1:508-1806(+)
MVHCCAFVMHCSSRQQLILSLLLLLGRYKRLRSAVAKIKEKDPHAKVEYMELDLASFRSINNFATEFNQKGLPLHCLINNAGVQTPYNAKTKDGLTLVIGIDYYGHLYLTHLLLPALKGSAPSRIVWVSSPAETLGKTNWDDLRYDHAENDFEAYATSKLWDLMVAFELNKRLHGTGVDSFACHPGTARTDIFRKSDHEKMSTVITDWMQWLGGQSAESGALPLLYCATAPELEGKGGTYYGPYYKGPLTANVLNTSQRTPGNPEANDTAACARLYHETTTIVNEIAKAKGLDQVTPLQKAAAAAPACAAEGKGQKAEPGEGLIGGVKKMAETVAATVSEGMAALGLTDKLKAGKGTSTAKALGATGGHAQLAAGYGEGRGTGCAGTLDQGPEASGEVEIADKISEGVTDLGGEKRASETAGSPAGAATEAC